MKDILGQALLDYMHGRYDEDIITSTSISEEDILPLPYLFRSYSEMPYLEQQALEHSHGTVLDVGCGAGSHSLYLQEQGLEVIAIDTSPGAVAVCKERGIKNCRVADVLSMNGTFDTILLLMNGSGIFQTVERVPEYLLKLKSLLEKGGQVLLDSSDLQYMYDRDDNGAILVPGDRYYGELDYRIAYRGMRSDPFPMLYLDAGLLAALCEESGLNFEVLAHGEHFDYLAKLTV